MHLRPARFHLNSRSFFSFFFFFRLRESLGEIHHHHRRRRCRRLLASSFYSAGIQASNFDSLQNEDRDESIPRSRSLVKFSL